MRSPIPLLSCLLMVLFGACSGLEDRQDITAVEITRSESAVVPADPAGRLGAALAQGLSRPAVRAGLRNALRASPYTDHRLGLKEFLRTRPGRELLDAAAIESGISRSVLEEWLEAYPALDIYIPFREHRMTWRGGQEIQLAVIDQENEGATSLRVFSTDGVAGTLTREGGIPAYALVVIAPSEYKIRRYRPQRASAGSVIQDPDDGEAGAEFVAFGPDGTPLYSPVPLAIDPDECVSPYATRDVSVQCSVLPPIDEEVSPAPATADTTFLRSFIIHEGFEPFWDGSMEIRMEIKHHRYTDPGAVRSTLATGVLRFSGIRADRTYTVERIAMFSRLVESGRDGISYWLDEEDVFFNDWVGADECRQIDGCQANGVPLKVYHKSDDCGGSIPDYNVGCTRRHTATVTARWTPKY